MLRASLTYKGVIKAVWAWLCVYKHRTSKAKRTFANVVKYQILSFLSFAKNNTPESIGMYFNKNE